MNTIQIRAFIKALKKTKGVLNEKRKHVDKTTNSNCGGINIISPSSIKQDGYGNETISVKKPKTTK